MYYPYFRGKQYELISIRESVSIITDSEFVPIIEPVKVEMKDPLGSVRKTLTALEEGNARAIVIVNPFHGDFSEDSESISNLLMEFTHYPLISVGILLKETTTIDQVLAYCKNHPKQFKALIHAGFSEGKQLVLNCISSQ